MQLRGHKGTTGGHSHNGKVCASPWQLLVHADNIIHASVIGEAVHFHWALAWPVRSSGVLNPKLSDVRGERGRGEERGDRRGRAEERGADPRSKAKNARTPGEAHAGGSGRRQEGGKRQQQKQAQRQRRTSKQRQTRTGQGRQRRPRRRRSQSRGERAGGGEGERGRVEREEEGTGRCRIAVAHGWEARPTLGAMRRRIMPHGSTPVCDATRPSV